MCVWQVPLTEDVECIIVASDGLWHLMDNGPAVKHATGKLTAEEVCCG